MDVSLQRPFGKLVQPEVRYRYVFVRSLQNMGRTSSAARRRALPERFHGSSGRSGCGRCHMCSRLRISITTVSRFSV